jgi:predicted phage terminase large subunit-like protein
MTAPAPSSPPVLWEPNPGVQTEFLSSDAREVLYGGAAGGGKSAAIIAAPLRWIEFPDFRCLTLRREATQLGNLIDKSQLYRHLGASFHGTDLIWTFPEGAEVRFAHCKDEADKFNFSGDELQLIQFDELTHFTLGQYQEICSRLRSPNPLLPRYIRATTNPGGIGHEWVLARWGAWLNKDFEAEGLSPRFDEEGERLPPARPGEILWVLKVGDDEVYVPKGTPRALSRQFIPAKLSDNPKLTEADPEYEIQLEQHDRVRRAQLKDGNWLAVAGKGDYFKRQWFRMLPARPVCTHLIRYWDRAGSVAGDWTVGALMGRTAAGRFVVLDVARMRGRPGEVLTFMQSTAAADGKRVVIGLEQDPGQAGVDQIESTVKALAGYRTVVVRPTGKKAVRAGPFSSQCESGNVDMVIGPWNQAYFKEAEDFPEGANDDQIDASSGAFNWLAGAPASIAIEQPTGGGPARSSEMGGW